MLLPEVFALTTEGWGGGVEGNKGEYFHFTMTYNLIRKFRHNRLDKGGIGGG